MSNIVSGVKFTGKHLQNLILYSYHTLISYDETLASNTLTDCKENHTIGPSFWYNVPYNMFNPQKRHVTRKNCNIFFGIVYIIIHIIGYTVYL